MPNNSIHAWLILWNSARAVEIYAHKSIQNRGLGLTDFAVLEALLNKGPLLVNTLGKKVLLTSGSVTAAVDRLEKQGLVERRNDPNDRRARHVHLTAKGHELIGKAFAQHQADIDQLMLALGSAERTQLIASLRKLGQAAEQLTANSVMKGANKETSDG